MKGIGIVPARKGSKRLENKNMLTISGMPMTVFAYRTLRMASLDRVIVATDIKEMYEHVKPENILWRPKELNGDEVPVQDVIKWAYRELDEDYDYIVALLPNCPGIEADDIINSVDIMFTNKLNVLRSYDTDGIENGLLVARADYYMNHPADTYCGGIITQGTEIHDINDYMTARKLIEV